MLPPSEQAAALYRTWFGMMEQWARMFSPSLHGPPSLFAAAQPGVDATARGIPDPVKPIAEALSLTRHLLTQYYGALAPALGATAAGQDWQSLATANTERLKTFFESGVTAQKQFLENGTRAIGQLAQSWTGQRTPLAFGGLLPVTDGGTGYPLLDGLDRTFSAVADAFGLGPSRALRDAWRELIAADAQRRKAQLDYFTVVTSGWSKVIEGVGKRLGEMRASGERVESLVDLVRLWAGVAEKTLHEAMQSKPGLDATAEYLRAALRYRQQQNRLVEILSGLLNVPARSEVDDAYLEIQTLKRQVRALQREVRTLSNPSRPARRKSEERSRGESS